jgi:hypothetical protein
VSGLAIQHFAWRGADLSGLSGFFGLSGSENEINEINQIDQTNQLHCSESPSPLAPLPHRLQSDGYVHDFAVDLPPDD